MYAHTHTLKHTHAHTCSAGNTASQNASDKDNIQSTPARTGRTPGKSVCVCVSMSLLLPLPPLPPLPVTLLLPLSLVYLSLFSGQASRCGHLCTCVCVCVCVFVCVCLCVWCSAPLPHPPLRRRWARWTSALLNCGSSASETPPPQAQTSPWPSPATSWRPVSTLHVCGP
jgi:hypothetical protein